MPPIEAIYQGGVFRPLGEVHLPENQRVRLQVQPVEERDVRAWLEQARQLQQQLIARQGLFPDSTPDITADRDRDRVSR